MQEVLAEGPSPRDPSRLAGRTRDNRIAVFEGPPSLAGQLVPVRVTGATARVLRGERVEAPAAVGLCRPEPRSESLLAGPLRGEGPRQQPGGAPFPPLT